jgi:hypothetical protein
LSYVGRVSSRRTDKIAATTTEPPSKKRIHTEEIGAHTDLFPPVTNKVSMKRKAVGTGAIICCLTAAIVALSNRPQTELTAFRTQGLLWRRREARRIAA